jgi:tyrosyl-tRNA synthetase
MSISDDTMWSYWTLLTDLRPAEIDALKAEVASGALHPKTAKMRLAFRLVADFHGDKAARNAEEEFARRFSGASGAVSAEAADGPPAGTKTVAAVLVRLKMAPSMNVARQKVREGAVAVSDDGRDWRKVESPGDLFEYGPQGTRFLRLGKQFRLIRSSSSQNPKEVS